MAATYIVPPEVVKARMEIAEAAMKKALLNGETLDDFESVKRILQDSETNLGSSGFFDVLPEKDIFGLTIRLVRSSTSRVPLSLRPPPSPPESFAEDTISPQCEIGSGQGEIADTEESLRKPTYNQNEKQFTVKYQNPRTGLWEVGKAKYCEQEESFISQAVVEPNNLTSLMRRNRTILLCWEKAYGDSEIPKAVKTRFKIVPDNQIDNDMAIGTAYMKLDETDINISVEDGEERLQVNQISEDWEDRKAQWAARMFYAFNKKRPCEDGHPCDSMSKRVKGDSFG